jgi:hypothetical protein
MSLSFGLGPSLPWVFNLTLQFENVNPVLPQLQPLHQLRKLCIFTTVPLAKNALSCLPLSIKKFHYRDIPSIFFKIEKPNSYMDTILSGLPPSVVSVQLESFTNDFYVSTLPPQISKLTLGSRVFLKKPLPLQTLKLNRTFARHYADSIPSTLKSFSFVGPIFQYLQPLSLAMNLVKVCLTQMFFTSIINSAS